MLLTPQGLLTHSTFRVCTLPIHLPPGISFTSFWVLVVPFTNCWRRLLQFTERHPSPPSRQHMIFLNVELHKNLMFVHAARASEYIL